MNNIQRLTNEGLLDEYLYYYIKCTLDRLDVLRKEVR